MKRRLTAFILLASILLSAFGFTVYGDDGVETADVKLPRTDLEALFEDEAVSESNSAEGEPESVSGYYSLNVKFDEAFFADDACTYDGETAIFTLAMAMAGFSRNNDETEAQRTYYLREFYDAFNFGNAEYHNYDRDITYSGDDSAYSFASRVLSDGTALVAVICRGYGYGAEWASNVRLTPFVNGATIFDGYHSGFGESAEKVYADVIEYITRLYGGVKDVKVVLTGYSRGASILNLTAAMLCGDSRFSPSDIFAYCFAPPANVRTPLGLTKSDSLYPRIYNIINPGDVVPYAVSDHYGFHRYGRDIVLPSSYSCEAYGDFMSETSYSCVSVFNYSKYLQRMLVGFPEISRAAQLFIDDFLCRAVPTIFDYARPRLSGSSVQENAADTMVAFFGVGGTKLSAAKLIIQLFPGILEFCLNLDGEDGALLTKYLGVHVGTDGLDLTDAFRYLYVNHLPESYFSMLLALRKLDIDPSTTNAGRTRVMLGALKSSSSASLVCDSYTGNACEFWIENDHDFSLDVSTDYIYSGANEKRELSIRVERYDDGGALESVKIYDGLPFFKTSLVDIEFCSSYSFIGGKDLVLTSNPGVKLYPRASSVSYGGAFRAYTNDSALGEVKTTGTVYDLGLVDYDRYYFFSREPSFITGNVYGLILGGSFFRPKVRLTATAYEGAAFTGWYENGELIGIEPEIELEAGYDRDITAVFIPLG